LLSFPTLVLIWNFTVLKLADLVTTRRALKRI
jgi:hypothetical protein